MAREPLDSFDRFSHANLIGVVRDLIREVERLRGENEALGGALAKLRIEHQAVKDELARLKHLPPRPPIKPSGMERATRGGATRTDGEKGGRSMRRRTSHLDKLTIGATIVVKANPPSGSRNKGFEEIVVQDLGLTPTVTLYRRERFEAPDGGMIVAELDTGIIGGYGRNLHRLAPALHFQGQMTCERIVALLVGLGIVISKRQVVRMPTATLETFRAEDAAVLKPGLTGACVTVDGPVGTGEAGARVTRAKSSYATQIGSDRFCVFRTGPSKSRLAFLSRLCLGTALYVINQAALDYMKERALPEIVIDQFAAYVDTVFSSRQEWEHCLDAPGLTGMRSDGNAV